LASYQQARQALGARLRQLRKDADLTSMQLATLLGWPQSKVSRIETGKQAASEDDLAAWAQAIGASSEVASELLARRQAVQVDYAAWRRQHRSGVVARQQAILDLEAEVPSIRAFEPAVIPGLLQTAGYARWLLAEGPELYAAPDDVAEALRVRMQRQQVLYEPAKRFHFVVTEAALRFQLCPLEELRGQLDRLIALSTLDNVELGIIPFSVRMPLAPVHGFWLFDDQVVTVETFAAELVLREPEEIALYAKVFDTMRAAAWYDDQARSIVTRVLQDSRQPVG